MVLELRVGEERFLASQTSEAGPGVLVLVRVKTIPVVEAFAAQFTPEGELPGVLRGVFPQATGGLELFAADLTNVSDCEHFVNGAAVEATSGWNTRTTWSTSTVLNFHYTTTLITRLLQHWVHLKKIQNEALFNSAIGATLTHALLVFSF